LGIDNLSKSLGEINVRQPTTGSNKDKIKFLNSKAEQRSYFILNRCNALVAELLGYFAYYHLRQSCSRAKKIKGNIEI